MKNYELPDYGLFQMIHECQDKRFVYKAKKIKIGLSETFQSQKQAIS